MTDDTQFTAIRDRCEYSDSANVSVEELADVPRRMQRLEARMQRLEARTQDLEYLLRAISQYVPHLPWCASREQAQKPCNCGRAPIVARCEALCR